MSDDNDTEAKVPDDAGRPKTDEDDGGARDEESSLGSPAADEPEAPGGDESHDDEVKGDDQVEKESDDPSEGDEEAPARDDFDPSSEDDEDDEDLGLQADPLASADDEIDPELLALGEKPAPKWYRALVMAGVCIVVLIMMVWFRLELLYFFSPTEPIDLGDADSAVLGDEVANRYVRFDGVPLAPRAVNPAHRCGNMQGFPTYQKRFLCRGHLSAIPLMGRPDHDLIVQRYLARQLRVSFSMPDEGRGEAIANAVGAVHKVHAVHTVRRTEPYEIGQLIVEVQGRTGQTDMSAVMKSMRFHLESSVVGIGSIEIERVNRDAPGAFLGRAIRVSELGSRFAAVEDYLEECTDYSLGDDAFVILDGSEAGEDLLAGGSMCYGQSPRQYWPYLLLYIALVAIFILNLYLFVRFAQAWRAGS